MSEPKITKGGDSEAACMGAFAKVYGKEAHEMAGVPASSSAISFASRSLTGDGKAGIDGSAPINYRFAEARDKANGQEFSVVGGKQQVAQLDAKKAPSLEGLKAFNAAQKKWDVDPGLKG